MFISLPAVHDPRVVAHGCPDTPNETSASNIPRVEEIYAGRHGVWQLSFNINAFANSPGISGNDTPIRQYPYSSASYPNP